MQIFRKITYRETDPVIGNDSFQSFEFILKTANEMKVKYRKQK